MWQGFFASYAESGFLFLLRFNAGNRCKKWTLQSDLNDQQGFKRLETQLVNFCETVSNLASIKNNGLSFFVLLSANQFILSPRIFILSTAIDFKISLSMESIQWTKTFRKQNRLTLVVQQYQLRSPIFAKKCIFLDSQNLFTCFVIEFQIKATKSIGCPSFKIHSCPIKFPI